MTKSRSGRDRIVADVAEHAGFGIPEMSRASRWSASSVALYVALLACGFSGGLITPRERPHANGLVAEAATSTSSRLNNHRGIPAAVDLKAWALTPFMSSSIMLHDRFHEARESGIDEMACKAIVAAQLRGDPMPHVAAARMLLRELGQSRVDRRITMDAHLFGYSVEEMRQMYEELMAP